MLIPTSTNGLDKSHFHGQAPLLDAIAVILQPVNPQPEPLPLASRAKNEGYDLSALLLRHYEHRHLL
ncbi:MAG: hypothetical protein ABIW82_05515 [Dokdonella sp.]